MSQEFTIPLECDLLGVSKETFDRMTEAVIKRIVETCVPIEVGSLDGIKIYVQPHIPKDMILMLGKDPDFPGRTKILKIVKFVLD